MYTGSAAGERLEGAGIINFTLPPDGKKVYKISLKVDKVHHFVGAGSGGQVDYFVYDPNGNQIAYDMEMGSDCDITFTPKVPGYYFFLAKNYSDEASTIVVRTN